MMNEAKQQMKKRILITGTNGQVGWSLQQTCPLDLIELIAPQEGDLDITNQSNIEAAIDMHKPDMIINAAAYTAVDKAEEEKDIAMLVNADGPLLLAQCCQKNNIPLFHFSTDYVFDGKKETPYTESDQPHPINIYGKTKLIGEQNIQQHLAQYIILRISGVFCSHGNNFVKTMLRLAQEKESLSIVSDQITCPTPAIDVATTVWKITENIFQGNAAWGIYHYCASPPVSWFEFAREIISKARQFKPVKTNTITPVSSEEYQSPARRLSNAVLNCKKIKAVLGIDQIPWHIELEKIIKEQCS